MRNEHDIAGKQIKVVHVVLTLDVGGLERGVVNQVREGCALGQTVAVVCLDHAGTLRDRVEAMGVPIVELSRRPGLRPGLVVRLRGVLAALRPDVVHTHQLATLLYAGTAARSLRVPVIVHTEHGREAYATRWKTRLLGRTSSRLCDRFYCLTSEMAQRCRQHRIVPERKLRVIRNGIDLSQFQPVPDAGRGARRSLGIPLDAPLIGTVGRLSEVKRQDVLIKAFARTHATFPQARLLLVGDGPLLAELRGLAQALGVGESVHFAGYQPHSAPFLNAIDIFALTSRSEGMPQAVLEACASGLPVVASRVGGLPEVICDEATGLLFESGDDVALAAALKRLLADASLRAVLGNAAREFVQQRFSVKEMAATYHRDFVELFQRWTTRLGSDVVGRQLVGES